MQLSDKSRGRVEKLAVRSSGRIGAFGMAAASVVSGPAGRLCNKWQLTGKFRPRAATHQLLTATTCFFL